MKVLILNQHANNFGDEAAGYAVVKNLLKNKKVEKIELLYCRPRSLPIEDKRVIHNHDLDVRKLTRKDFLIYLLTRKKVGQFIPEYVEKLKEYDTVLISPCGANLGIYKDWALLLQDIIAVMQKRTPIFHLNTIGKSGNKIFDFGVQYLCKRSRVYVREKASYEYLKGKNIKVKLGTDSVFGLDKLDENIQKKNKIVFVPSDVWDWHVDYEPEDRDVFYKNILNPLLDFAREHNMSISILPHINTEKETKFNQGILAYAKENYGDVSIEMEQAKEFFDYENGIRTAELVVGMRYHTIVFAVKNAIPFVAIAYEQKTREVSNYSGKLDNCVKIKDLKDATIVKEKLEHVYNNLEVIQNELKGRIDKITEKSLIVIKENFNE